jgi:hypothetical protein
LDFDDSFDSLKHHYLNETNELTNVGGDLVYPTSIDIIDTTSSSHWEPSVLQDLHHPFDKSIDPRTRRLKTRRLLNRKKNF